MRDTFPPKAIGISSALFAIALILGPALGPLAGGYLTDNFSWQWIFDVNVVPGIASLAIILALLRNPVAPARVKIDWLGVGLLALGLGALQVLLDNGERSDWFSDPSMVVAALLSLTGLSTFAWWQWSGTRSPAVDLHVLKLRGVWTGSVLALAFGTMAFAPAIVTPLYTSLVLGYTAFDSGLLLVMRALPVVILTPVFATLAQRGMDVRYLIGGGFAITAASLTWLALHMTPDAPFAQLGAALFVSGVGQSMILVPLIVGVLGATPAALNGKVSPIITLCVQLGGSISECCLDRVLRSANGSSLRRDRRRDDDPAPQSFRYRGKRRRSAATRRHRRPTVEHDGLCRHDPGHRRGRRVRYPSSTRVPQSEAIRMNGALESMYADLLAAGVTIDEAWQARGLYARAVQRQDEASWITFYRAVFAALNRTGAATALAPSAARASLLRLLEDDLGSMLFSPVPQERAIVLMS